MIQKIKLPNSTLSSLYNQLSTLCPAVTVQRHGLGVGTEIVDKMSAGLSAISRMAAGAH
jgi:hypothetical protein